MIVGMKKSPQGNRHYELNNHLGNVLAVVTDRKMAQDTTINATYTPQYFLPDVYAVQNYYAFGQNMPKWSSSALNDPKRYRFGYNGKEDDDEWNKQDYGFRIYDTRLARFLSVDPLTRQYAELTPYQFASNRPIDGIDLDGLEWKGTSDNNGVPNGYQWDPANAWEKDKDGNKVLKNGYYHQAIFFSENGTFDADNKYNIGSSTATVFEANGSTLTFDATTYPSDLEEYPTVPEGRYEANVGLHKGQYTALRMHDIDDTNSRIELGFENPAFDDGRTYATGINIHKPGRNNYTGVDSKGRPCSAGCMLVDRNNWDNFIGLFDTDNQRDNPVGVTISRTYANPVISVYSTSPIFLQDDSYLIQRDATRVVLPLRTTQ
jgi:RHS repeat-associated protein